MVHNNQSLTSWEVRQSAKETVSILKNNKVKCCLFGSLACHIQGMKYRRPADVDLVILNHGKRNAEYFKELVASSDSDRFYLEKSTNPKAKYKKLFYRVTPYQGRGPSKVCKIDILIAGQDYPLQIPNVPVSCIQYSKQYPGLPVMPLLPLLLMKLQGWYDHRESHRKDQMKKRRRDIADIDKLLKMAKNEECHLDEEIKGIWRLPKWFTNRMRRFVGEYIEHFPDTEEDWNSLGFE
ncbi:hypothetical protein K435DRAFT_877714 [Dendrothele bispora CBS 962.96]|uniref:Uncharacterized protein n=1 Tax=Dendrothele bispora (strain CBS 962.96) TaxID=1314807 RepID=A0A4S8KPH0_DENBC|nr:hypothetical protein K435DRAFT_877714 [Dendrothele bispora CBS 962.96]